MPEALKVGSGLDRILEIGKSAVDDRLEAISCLNQIFRSGTLPSKELDGFYAGSWVAPALSRRVDPLLRAATSIYLPWHGKRFDAASASGQNILTPSAGKAVRLLWPTYRLDETDDGNLAGFNFKTYSGGPGQVDPEIEVLKIDYRLETNPGYIVPKILDQLVEIEPGLYLGKMLYKLVGSWHRVGFFALSER